MRASFVLGLLLIVGFGLRVSPAQATAKSSVQFSVQSSMKSFGGLVVIASALKGELNAMTATASALDPDFKVLSADQIDLRNPPEFIFHALASPEEIAFLSHYKAEHPDVKLINFGDPKDKWDQFDLIIASSNSDPIPDGRVYYAEGVATNIDQRVETTTNAIFSERLARARGKKIVTVVMGGHTKFATYKPSFAKALALNLNELRRVHPDVQFMISSSRRTPAFAEKVFADYFKADPNDYILTNAEADLHGNPYVEMLRSSDYVIVTGDSMSMIADSILLGKPTYIFAPDGSLEDRHKRLIVDQFKKGRVRPFTTELVKYNYLPLRTGDLIASYLKKSFPSSRRRLSCHAAFPASL